MDADEEALYSQAYRKYMSADIVQFVPFNDFKSNPHLLAKAVLEELPGQLLNYMRRRDITPLPKSEEQRRQMQQQLSMRPVAAPGTQPVPKYFTDKKERFLQEMVSYGFDLYKV